MSDIIVLTPGDWLRGEFVTSLVGTINKLQEQGLKVLFGNGQASIVARARQTPYEAIRQQNFDRLVWIDSDMGWHWDAFLKLTSTNYDILTGAYLDEIGRVVATRLDGNRVSREQLDSEKTFEVASCGFGFLSLSKKVVTALAEPFLYPMEYGEDIAFCMNARNMGFQIFFDPTIKVTHYKTIAINP